MKVGESVDKVVTDAMNSPKVLDTNVRFDIPEALEGLYNPKQHKYKCSCCGKGYVGKQGNNFQRSPSPLFQANNGFLPWCKSCTEKYYKLLVDFYSGNEEHALEHFCQQVDWVYEPAALKASLIARQSCSRAARYAIKKNINVGGRKTFIDTMKYNYKLKKQEAIMSKEQAKTGDGSVSASAIDRWGLGLTEADYKILDEHYRMLKKNNPNCDNNQEIFIKTLCNLNMLMLRALQHSDSDKYVKLTEQYSKTFAKAGLKTVQETDGSADETLGVTLATISQYTPEEYYLGKDLYKDHDKLGEYFERFVKRPLKNLMMGTNTRDKEYYVKDDTD